MSDTVGDETIQAGRAIIDAQERAALAMEAYWGVGDNAARTITDADNIRATNFGYFPTPQARERKRYFAVVDEAHLKFPQTVTRMPRRADDGSAGYDFHAKETVSIQPGEMHVFWTDVKVYMRRNDEVFKIFIRSSLAYNRNLSLANDVGIIDRSYFGNEKNDGNIGIGIRNMSNEVQHITTDERIAQGIFEDFYIVDNDEARIEEEHGVGRVRSGGMGSTGTTNLNIGLIQAADPNTVHWAMPTPMEDGIAAYIQRMNETNARITGTNITTGRILNTD